VELLVQHFDAQGVSHAKKFFNPTTSINTKPTDTWMVTPKKRIGAPTTSNHL